MLGTVGDEHLDAVLQALIAGDPAQLVAIATQMESRSLSFAVALQALASLLTRIAIIQTAPQAVTDPSEIARLSPYAQSFDPEFLQLSYQIVIHARNELYLAPDEYTGFVMALLRLHAFRPETPPPLQPNRVCPEVVTPLPRAAMATTPPVALPVTVAPQQPTPKAPSEEPVVPATPTNVSIRPEDWHGLIRQMGLAGMVRELAQHCELVTVADQQVLLRLAEAHKHLLQLGRGAQDKLQQALSAQLRQPVRIHIEVGEVSSITPAQRDLADRQQRHADAVAALESDPIVGDLIERFDATLVENSVTPL
jgi:DNA polymerase-3 subunit gamma/tau